MPEMSEDEQKPRTIAKEPDPATNFVDAKQMIRWLEAIISRTIGVDPGIDVTAPNKEFEHASDLFAEATRVKNTGEIGEAAQIAGRALIIAEAAAVDLSMILHYGAKNRLRSADPAHEFDVRAKLKLECARYLLKVMNQFDALIKAGNSLLTIQHPLEADAIVFCWLKDERKAIANDPDEAISRPADPTATLRWDAA
jgi:hypothetical protein